MSFPTSVEVESGFEFDAVAAFARTETRRKVPNTRIPLGLARGYYIANVFWTAEVAGSVGPRSTDHSRIATRKGPIQLHLQDS